jgi:hypothetical protein
VQPKQQQAEKRFGEIESHDPSGGSTIHCALVAGRPWDLPRLDASGALMQLRGRSRDECIALTDHKGRYRMKRAFIFRGTCRSSGWTYVQKPYSETQESIDHREDV